jgi:hypothetical protein
MDEGNCRRFANFCERIIYTALSSLSWEEDEALSRLTLQLAAASSISSLTESRMPGKVARSTCCWPSRSTRFRCIGLARESETVESTIPVECEALKNTEPHILPACRRFSSCIPRTAASRTARASKTVMAGFWNRADHRPIFVLVEGTRI